MTPKEILAKAKEAVDKALAEKKLAKEMISSLGPAIVETLEPILKAMAENSKATKEDFLEAIKGIKIEVPKADVPQAEVKVTIPEIPAAQVTVNQSVDTKPIEEAIKTGLSKVQLPSPRYNFTVPDIKLPVINVPEAKVSVSFPDKIQALLDYDYRRPLPVIMMDQEGKPFQFSFGVGGGSGGGGKADFFTIKDIRASTISVIDQDVGAIRVVGNLTASLSGSTSVTITNYDGLAYNSDNPLPVTFSAASIQPVSQVSGHAWSTNVVTIFGSTVTDSLINADNRLRVSVETGGSGLTDSELRASSVPVTQASDVQFSVYATGAAASFFAELLNPDGRVKVEMPAGSSGLTDSELRASSVPVAQASGAKWSTEASIVSISDIFSTTTTSTVVNPDNRVRVELPAGTSGLTDTELRATAVPVSQVSGVSWSTAVTNTVTVDGSGVTQPVSATDLDIRDLANATDSVSVYQVSGHSWSTSATITGTPTVSVTDIFGSVGTNVVNPDGRLKVELPTGSSGLTDTELRASSVPVAQASGASWSTSASIVSITDIFSTTATSSVVNPDNRVKVELPAGGSGLTDTELRATAVPVSQVSGASWSTEATQSGTWNITTVTSITNSVATALVDSSGVQYSASNPITVTVSNVSSSSITVGTTVADAVDDGSAPVKVGGIARTANPTAVSGGDSVSFSSDNLGRQVVRPVQVRGLIATAFAQATNGTETTLLAAGGAGVFHDLISVMASNNSTAAVTLTIRDVTAGNSVFVFDVPANGVAGIANGVVPYPQGNANNNWTIDLPDITGTTVSVTGLFAKEI